MSRVAVLIPNYNRGAMLEECLRSVLAQRFTDWTAVVGDNASTDDSVAVVERIRDRRLRLVRRPATIGWVANLNLLLAEAAGSDYIAVLHSDDWWEPGFLATTVGMLERSPSSLMATTLVTQVRAGRTVGLTGLAQFLQPGDEGVRSSVEVLRALTAGCRIFAPGVLARGGLYARLGSYEETLPQACDWLMWLRAAKAATVAVSPEPLANYRIHEQSLTAELSRANLRAVDMVRLLRMVQSEWREGEPFLGASKRLAHTIVVEMLADAANRAELSDRAGAVSTCRLAGAIAPTIADRALSGFVLAMLQLSSFPPLRASRRRVLRLGRSAWHGTQAARGRRAA